MSTATINGDAPTQVLAMPGDPDALEPARLAPRRVRGLRFPVLPTGGLIAQVTGAVAASVGLYLQFGLGATLIATGAAAAVLGALREAGKI